VTIASQYRSPRRDRGGRVVRRDQVISVEGGPGVAVRDIGRGRWKKTAFFAYASSRTHCCPASRPESSRDTARRSRWRRREAEVVEDAVNVARSPSTFSGSQMSCSRKSSAGGFRHHGARGSPRWPVIRFSISRRTKAAPSASRRHRVRERKPEPTKHGRRERPSRSCHRPAAYNLQIFEKSP